MTDDIIEILDSGGSYLESLCKSRKHLQDNPVLLAELDALIKAEIDVGILCVEKSKSDILKQSKHKLTPVS